MPEPTTLAMELNASDIAQDGAFTKWVQMVACHNNITDSVFPLDITLNGQAFHLDSYDMMMILSRALTLGLTVTYKN